MSEDRPGIVVVGLSHKTAPVEVREAMAVSKADLPGALERLRRDFGLAEAMILSTCNRVELYAPGGSAAVDALASFLLERAGSQAVEPLLYRLRDEDAVRHAFRVAAGLDSLVLGEAQILGQVKEAYQAAQEAGALGAALGALRHRTLSVAKRARAETGIGRHAVSIPQVAVEVARKIFGSLQDRNVLVVGAGRMCRLAARRLAREGARLTVLGRTVARAEELAAALGGRAASLEDLRDELTRADIALTGTGAPGTVIAREDVESARAARGPRPLFLIDIAVPRDVDASVRGLGGVFLYDVDDLQSVAEANLRERQREARAAEALVEREAREFLALQRSGDGAPLLVELRRRGDEIRRAETARARRRMGPLTPEQERALEAMTNAIVNKLLHAPTAHLKQLAREGAAQEAGLLRALLGLS